MSKVDGELLNLIESWRTALAKNIVLRNGDISVNNLNALVQKIIDRIIFLRIAEDKGIEEFNRFKSVFDNCDIYKNLNQIFINAHTKYNSGLFSGESLEEVVKIDDNILSNMITNLYYPDCHYDFSKLPAEILGNIYENFLDKTIYFRNSKGNHTTIIETKLKIRKAGGVFYTPQYIVTFIVKNTVGRIITGKTPEEISQLKIVDPACGSGSMLVGAYQFILDYHLDYYTLGKNIKLALKNNKIYESDYKTYKLTIAEKRRILLNNIFGVDIDAQAVEITKLSLYLKLLEDGCKITEGQVFHSSESKLLSALDGNIKCGNSLVGTDFYQHDKLKNLSEEQQVRINCFDWEKEFPSIFEHGGFDAVIGNPPYYNIQSLGAGNEEVLYIQNRYSEIWQDKSDILFYFIYKALQISKSEIGYIVSNAFLFSDKALRLRNLILSDGRFTRAVNFERYQVFADASITSGIIIFNGNHKNNTIKATVFKNKNADAETVANFINDNKNYFSVTLNRDNVFALVDSKIAKLNKKIDGKHPLLRDLFLVGRGMETGANDIFLFNEYPSQFPKQFIKRRISGENIRRYFADVAMDFVLYVEDVDEFDDLPTAIRNYLTANKKKLKNRADKKRRHCVKWWNYTFPLHKEKYHTAKICCSYRNKNNEFILSEDCDSLCLSNTSVIFAINPNYPLKYLLAILNSKLFKWRYQYLAKQTGGGIFEYMPNGIGKFPVPLLDLSNETDRIRCDNFVVLVNEMLRLKYCEQAELNSSAKKFITNQIKTIDNKIDEAIYKLYGLNDDEIINMENDLHKSLDVI
ncbi:MAG: N-6 DNA methylase [Planctomycetaceae bacterium]|jgi:adenine-specific DNA-methyltransferase|nr:N-6 DNA methylase [Planctomycetaceae bacterium]